eukprot:TRINITY_DN4962_c0_g3_i1.p1 TRINITY_DN4962_c0_g3~~TRINITY_DN4962_c0_g3_i1.p1  ORF type:complete len:127 (-),score=31.79 TRINITY_DN4962_c0_g3_i1:61-441(-)
MMDVDFVLGEEASDRTDDVVTSTTVIYPARKVGGARVVQHTSTAHHVSEEPQLESHLLEATSGNLNSLVNAETLQSAARAEKLEKEAQKHAHQSREWESGHTKIPNRADHVKRTNVFQPGTKGTNH